MSEGISERSKRLFQFTDDVDARRKEVSEVLLLVFVAAAAVNFLTGLLTSYVWDKSCLAWWVWALVSTVLAIYSFFAFWAKYARSIKGQFHLELLLPLRRQPKIEAVKGNYYTPLHQFDLRVREFFAQKAQDKVQKQAEIIKEWESFIETNHRTISMEKTPKLLAFLNDLAEFLIFDTLVDFSKASLTPHARFTRFGWVRPNYVSRALQLDKELVALKSNLIIGHLSDRVPQSLRFLEGFIFHRQSLQGQKKKDAGNFQFVSKHGSMLFTISSFPVIMPLGSRDVNVIARYCGIPTEELVVIKVPVAMTVDFRVPLIRYKDFIENIATWIEDLVNAVKQNLDWQHCAQHDLERMVVELKQQITQNK